MLDILDQLAATAAALAVRHQLAALNILTDPHSLEWAAVPIVWGFALHRARTLL